MVAGALRWLGYDLAGPLGERDQKIKRPVADPDRPTSLRQPPCEYIQAEWPERED